jgi:hypothetical protein
MNVRASFLLVAVVACGGETQTNDGGVDAQAEAEAGNVGSCGKAAHDCLCACDDGGDCTSCYQTYPTCTTCIDDAVTTCCPTEYPAYTKCLDDSQKATADGGPPPCSPSDTTCQNAFCSSQAAGLQTCLATQACKTGRTQCTGTCP